MADLVSELVGQPTGPRPPKRKRAARWQPEIDPLRSRVLFELASAGYERRHGRRPKPSDLNREFPASTSPARPWGPWNRVLHGKGLPRKHSTPQSFLMKKLGSVDPRAAASVDWVLWPLASQKELTLPEIHAHMLDLPDGVGNMLIRRMPTGRYYRTPTNSMDELDMLVSERNLGGFMGLVALLREAELEQNAQAYTSLNGALRMRFALLQEALNGARVGEDICSFLQVRFSQMRYHFRGAYERHPRDDRQATPVYILLTGEDFEASRQAYEAEWLYGPANPLRT